MYSYHIHDNCLNGSALISWINGKRKKKTSHHCNKISECNIESKRKAGIWQLAPPKDFSFKKKWMRNI